MANIKLNNNEYPIPDSVLAGPTADFVAHLGTIAGNGLKVVINGVEYGVDSNKVSGAVSELEAVLGDLNNPAPDTSMEAGLYDANDVLLASWSALVDDYGMDATSNYTYGTFKKSASSPYNVLHSNDNLMNGVKLIFPNDIRIVGDYAFSECTSLTSVVIPASVETIGESAFADCTSLKSVSFAEDGRLKTIGNGAFSWCENLTSVVIPASVETINGVAFSSCTSLESVSFAENGRLKTIDFCAFDSCTKLTNIIIPDGVTSIGYEVFYNCTALTSIAFNGTVEKWNAITKGDDLNSGCPATYVQCSDGQVAL